MTKNLYEDMDFGSSEIDKINYINIRSNIDNLLASCAHIHDNEKINLLDIAPEIHSCTKKYFIKSKIYTLDINKEYNPDFHADITNNSSYLIPNEFFNIVVCTEVLEHVYNPFKAVKEIYRILKPGGIVLASTPFNFQIHPPFPDLWRFTNFGLNLLFDDFTKVKITPLNDTNRPDMPIHYTITCTK